MKKHLYLFLLFCFLLSSCSEMCFGHLAKVKSEKNANQKSTIKAQKISSNNYNSIDTLEDVLTISSQSDNVKSSENEIVKTEVDMVNIPKEIVQNILFKKTETSKLSSSVLSKNQYKTENIEPEINRKTKKLATASFTLSIFGYFFFLFFISVITLVFESPMLMLFGIGGVIVEVLALLFGAESLRMSKNIGQPGSRKAKFGIVAASIFLLVLLLFMTIKIN